MVLWHQLLIQFLMKLKIYKISTQFKDGRNNLLLIILWPIDLVANHFFVVLYIGREK